MKTNVFIICLGFLVFGLNSYSQEKIKFGEVSVKDLEMNSYTPEPDAPAVVLYESKVLSFEIIQDELKIITQYHVRIKILTNEGLGQANAAIVYHNGWSNIESDQLSVLSGFTYNLENGKVQKIKLAKEHIFNEKVNDHYTHTKFAFQSVKPGSIIEYKYQIRSSRFFDIGDHYFQRSIPVATPSILFLYLNISASARKQKVLNR